MANKFLEQVELEDREKTETVHVVKYFHQSTIDLSKRFEAELGRHNYVTPTSYLELINSFKSLLKTKQDETMKAKRRYVVGLEKLAFAASQVCVFPCILLLTSVTSLFGKRRFIWNMYYVPAMTFALCTMLLIKFNTFIDWESMLCFISKFVNYYQ